VSCGALSSARGAESPSLPRLEVSPDHRSLRTITGQPFFYLADTAWELFHRLTREEAATGLSSTTIRPDRR
jgi:hypothetical protein